MREDIKERREDMIKEYYTTDKTVTRIAKELSKKYDVKWKTIYNDFFDRDEWLEEIIKFDNEGLAADKLLYKHGKLEENLWEIVNKAQSDSARLGALKTLDKMYARRMDMAQSVGKIRKEPEKIEHKGDLEFIARIRKYANEHDGDPESQQDPG